MLIKLVISVYLGVKWLYWMLIKPTFFANQFLLKQSTKKQIGFLFSIIVVAYSFQQLMEVTHNTITQSQEREDSFCQMAADYFPIEVIKQTEAIKSFSNNSNSTVSLNGFSLFTPSLIMAATEGERDPADDTVTISFEISGIAFPGFCFLDQNTPQLAAVNLGLTKGLLNNVIPNHLTGIEITLLEILIYATILSVSINLLSFNFYDFNKFRLTTFSLMHSITLIYASYIIFRNIAIATVNDMDIHYVEAYYISGFAPIIPLVIIGLIAMISTFFQHKVVFGFGNIKTILIFIATPIYASLLVPIIGFPFILIYLNSINVLKILFI